MLLYTKKGKETEDSCQRRALLLPPLLAFGALVEAGHGLIGGAQLHHQEERLLVVAERTCRLHPDTFWQHPAAEEGGRDGKVQSARNKREK